MKELELGQMLFATNTQSRTAPDFTYGGLVCIAGAINNQRGSAHGEGLLTDNYGQPEFVNEVFSMRTYCWCDGDRHKDGCPPNFEHRSGLKISWYKHAYRGRTINKSIDEKTWCKIVQECLDSIEATDRSEKRSERGDTGTRDE